MTRLFSIALVLLSLPLSGAEKPNILIIYADDLGYGDVSCYNPERGKITTPHIDSLATAGLRFTDGHSSSGVCSPSRYTLLTGRYHWRTSLQKGIVPLWGAPLISRDRLTLASLAKNHGYRTACIGKWHLGWNWPIEQGQLDLFRGPKKGAITTARHREAWATTFSKPIPGGPTAVGFEEYFGTDVPNWPPFCFIENDHTVGIPEEYGRDDLFKKNQASAQGPALKDWSLEPVLPALGERAANFINREAKTPKPFFLFLSLTSPHTPLAVNEEWKNKSGINAYADLVLETDALIGRVLKTLEETGIEENTLVLFTSDNGCAPYIGTSEMEKKGHFASGSLRGYKSDVWEGGHRVPFIIRWPGVVKANTTCDQLVHQADFMATLAGILGTHLKPDEGEDSIDLAPLLEGGTEPVRSNSVSCSSQGLPSFRAGGWKYIAGPGSGGWSKGGPAKGVQLYNLSNDLGETNNLAATQPERLQKMQQAFEKLIAEGRSTPGPVQQNDVTVKRYGSAGKALRE